MLAHIKPLASKISGTFENNRNEYLMSKIIYSQYVQSMFGNMCIMGNIFSDTMPVPWKSSVSGRGTVTYETPSQDVLDSFQAFYDATDLPEAIQSFDHVLNALSIESGPFHIFFPKLKNRLQRHLQYKYQGI